MDISPELDDAEDMGRKSAAVLKAEKEAKEQAAREQAEREQATKEQAEALSTPIEPVTAEASATDVPSAEPSAEASTQPGTQPGMPPADATEYLAQFERVKQSVEACAAVANHYHCQGDDEHRIKALQKSVDALTSTVSQLYALAVLQHNYFN